MAGYRNERGEMGYKLTEADLVWNRACTSLVAGDKALAALLHFHNLAMNGGVLHALECLSPRDLDGAISGYRYFGFHDVGDFLIEARSTAEASNEVELDLLEGTLDKLYSDLVPADTTLQERFERYFVNNPTHFARLDRGAPT